MKTIIAKQLVALGIAGTMTLGAEMALASDPVNIQMTTTWPEGINLIEADKHFVELVNKLGEDAINIDFFPGNTIVPSTQVFDAVRSGATQAAADWPGYWAGTNTAFSLLGSFPMLFSAQDYVLWINEWGGAEMFDAAYGEYGIKYLPYAVISTESGLRSTKPLASLDDLNGKRLRMSGRAQGAILAELGGAQVMLPGSEVYQSLERGVVDAAEFSSPSTDYGMGFQEVTQYWMAPGWHQPGSVAGVMIAQEVWDGLSDKQQFILKTAAQATMNWSIGYYERTSAEATKAFTDTGVTVSTLSAEDMTRLQEMSNANLVKEACDNPLFAKITVSKLEYLKEYEQWREMQGEFAQGRNLSTFPDLEAIRACAE
ncbi:TRAP transporter substrate-binding protein DctP [Sedimentitalea nanhaiensis]|uniref:TRAP-type mannitol/chloroaromatic compound transport system, substrate-binding protein n=1 Tax=Sedimentitalea nanhaiensis TaxID=999627 RepID=A0A1I7DFN4_9RHOB|nr:TRAP transporter substrate-binding protein DctP [Sedimentitalea nanhaiensis]SFU10522.1 TRAP-type mannitol/chloroaromatic compound transport system, substrate-binding protein [Sedimentitalea nanhaiensis]